MLRAKITPYILSLSMAMSLVSGLPFQRAYAVSDDVTYKEAINIARETIESGKAKEKLEQFIEMSNSFK